MIRMQQTVTTAGGRRLTFVATPNKYGRVVYDVDKIGAFTIEPQANYPGGDSPERVYVRYGRVDSSDPYSSERDLPDQPVVCTVQLGGGAVFDTAKIHSRRGGWLAVDRSRGGSAPDRIARRTENIVRVLVVDWLAREDHGELRGYHAWHLAPRRIAHADHNIARLNTVIAPLLSELAVEHHHRGEQMAILGCPSADMTAYPDPRSCDGQSILALRAQLAQLHEQHRRLPALDVVVLVEQWLAGQGLAIGAPRRPPAR
jgi:hypothetical protein